MTTSAGWPDGPRRDGLVRTLDALRTAAHDEAALLLGALPDTGDPVVGHAADDLVEQAADALRALAEQVSRTIRELDGPLGGRS